MADMYTPDQLGSIYGDWNPETYMQGRHQVGLSNQFQDQSLEQQRQKTQQDTLATQFKSQNNPQLLEKQALDNEASRYGNVEKGVNSRIAAATEGLKLDAEKMKQILSASDDQIKMMTNQAQQMGYSDDPVIQAKGQKLMQLSAAAVEARQKHKDEMEKQDLIRKSAERVAAGNNAATLGAARISADARKAGKAVDPNTVASKLGYEKGAAYYLIQAESADDPADAQRYRQMAAKFEQLNLNQKNAQAGGKPDLNKMGIETQQQPAVIQAEPSAPAVKPPAIGTVHKGYVYQGGDPSKPQSWKKQ